MVPSRLTKYFGGYDLRVFNDLSEIRGISPTAIALGNFDGVHVGHRKLIEEAVKKAEEENIKSAVFTFSNHPRNLIAGRNVVKNILYNEEKERIIESLGVDYMFNIEFTWEICNMQPEEFVEELLVNSFRAEHVFCGFNYSFGVKASGGWKDLDALGKELGFETHMIEPVEVDGNLVSSTYIRGLIETGQMKKCRKFMGESYSIGGEVVVGNKLGRTIGFPTSNLVIDEEMVTPPNGVYITNCIYNGVKYPSVTNVGVKPTIGEYKKNVETHIFNFDKELYGKNILVEFLEKTRDEKKFDSIEKLSEQIKKDCLRAKKYHGL